MGQLGDKILQSFSSFIDIFKLLVGARCNIDIFWACVSFLYIYDIAYVCIFDLLTGIGVFYSLYDFELLAKTVDSTLHFFGL